MRNSVHRGDVQAHLKRWTIAGIAALLFALSSCANDGSGAGGSPVIVGETSTYSWDDAGLRPLLFGVDGQILVLAGIRSRSGIETSEFASVDPVTGVGRSLPPPGTLTQPIGLVSGTGDPVVLGLDCTASQACTDGELTLATYDTQDEAWTIDTFGERRDLETYSAELVMADENRTVALVGTELLFISDGDVARVSVPDGARAVCPSSDGIILTGDTDSDDPEAAEVAGADMVELLVLDEAPDLTDSTWATRDGGPPGAGMGQLDLTCAPGGVIGLAADGVARWTAETGWSWTAITSGPTLPVESVVFTDADNMVALDPEGIWALQPNEWELVEQENPTQPPEVRQLVAVDGSVWLRSAEPQPTGTVRNAQIRRVG